MSFLIKDKNLGLAMKVDILRIRIETWIENTVFLIDQPPVVDISYRCKWQ